MSASGHRYAVGDRVEILRENPAGNPRTPRYARGRAGVITQLHGVIPNPLDHPDTYPPLCTLVFPVAGVDTPDVIAVDIHEDWLRPAG